MPIPGYISPMQRLINGMNAKKAAKAVADAKAKTTTSTAPETTTSSGRIGLTETATPTTTAPSSTQLLQGKAASTTTTTPTKTTSTTTTSSDTTTTEKVIVIPGKVPSLYDTNPELKPSGSGLAGNTEAALKDANINITDQKLIVTPPATQGTGTPSQLGATVVLPGSKPTPEQQSFINKSADVAMTEGEVKTRELTKGYYVGRDESGGAIYVPKTEENVLYGMKPSGDFASIESDISSNKDILQSNIGTYQANIQYLESIDPNKLQELKSNAMTDYESIKKMKENETITLMENGVGTDYTRSDAVKKYEDYFSSIDETLEDYSKLPTQKTGLTEEQKKLSDVVGTEATLTRYKNLGYVVEKTNEGYNIRNPTTQETFNYVYGEGRTDVLLGAVGTSDFFGLKTVGSAIQSLVTGDKKVQEAKLEELQRSALNISKGKALGGNVLEAIAGSSAVQEGVMFLGMEVGAPIVLSGASKAASKGLGLVYKGSGKVSTAIAEYAGSLSPTGAKIFENVSKVSVEVGSAGKFLAKETGESLIKVGGTKTGQALILGEMFTVMEGPRLAEVAIKEPEKFGSELGGVLGSWTFAGLAMKEGVDLWYKPTAMPVKPTSPENIFGSQTKVGRFVEDKAFIKEMKGTLGNDYPLWNERGINLVKNKSTGVISEEFTIGNAPITLETLEGEPALNYLKRTGSKIKNTVLDVSDRNLVRFDADRAYPKGSWKDTWEPNAPLAEGATSYSYQLEYRIPFADVKATGTRYEKILTEKGDLFRVSSRFEINKRVYLERPVTMDNITKHDILVNGEKYKPGKLFDKEPYGSTFTKEQVTIKEVGYLRDAESTKYRPQETIGRDIEIRRGRYEYKIGEGDLKLGAGGTGTPLKYYKSTKDLGLPSESMGLELESRVTNKDLFASLEKPYGKTRVEARGYSGAINTPLETVNRPLAREEIELLNAAEKGLGGVSNYWKGSITRIGGIAGLGNKIKEINTQRQGLITTNKKIIGIDKESIGDILKVNKGRTGELGILSINSLISETGKDMWSGTELGTDLGTETKTDLGTLIGTESITEQRTDLLQEQGLSLDTALDLRLDLESLSLTDTLRTGDLTTRLEPPKKILLPPPFFPRKKDEELIRRREKPKEQVTGGYDVLVKERSMYHGKVTRSTRFIKVNKNPLSERDAMNLGGNIADNTSAISFKLKSTRGKAQGLTELVKPFEEIKRKFTKRGEVWIEKPEFRIDTPGEKRGISALGWQSNKFKGDINKIKSGINKINVFKGNSKKIDMIGNNKNKKGGKRVRYF